MYLCSCLFFLINIPMIVAISCGFSILSTYVCSISIRIGTRIRVLVLVFVLVLVPISVSA